MVYWYPKEQLSHYLKGWSEAEVNTREDMCWVFYLASDADVYPTSDHAKC